MSFSNLDSDAGLSTFNAHLADHSYADGFTPSQADVTAFAAVAANVDGAKYGNVARWRRHIASFSSAERSAFPAAGTSNTTSKKTDAKKADAGDDDDFDLFESDDEFDEEYEKQVEERAAARLAAKAAAGKVVIAKSMVVLDVKPWEEETNLNTVAESIKKEIVMDGLVWGKHELKEVAFGIKKLVIVAIVEDAKVSVDDISEKIESNYEDDVQSVDVASFSKL
jgi:elongation factor 1-beta